MVDWLLFSGLYVILLIGEMIRQSQNNIFWMNKGGEWYTEETVKNKFGEWKGKIRDYNLQDKIKYAFMYRIVTVWTNWRDWTSALISSAWFAVVIYLIIRSLT